MRTRKKFFIICLLILGLFLFSSVVIYAFQQVNYLYQAKTIENSWEKAKKENKTKAEKEYLDLLNKQAKKENNQPTMTTEDERKAKGEYVLNIILVKPETVTESQIFDLVEKLKMDQDSFSKDCYLGTCRSNTSLKYAITYLNEEAKRYNVDNFNLKLKFHGIYTLENLNKIGNFAYLWNKDPFGIVKLKDAFESVLKANNLAFNKNDLTIFLYFDNTYNKDNNSEPNSFYEYKKFRSFADEEKGKTYINVYNFSPLFSEVLTEIVIHETLHLFGASDKYIENPTKRECRETGRGDTEQRLIFPQKTGDVMCGFVEYAKDKFYRGSIIDKNLVINQITAKEIGWKE